MLCGQNRMVLLVSRIILTVILLYALVLVWTNNVDLIKRTKATIAKLLLINKDGNEHDVAGDHVEGDKVDVTGDYVTGEKNVIYHTTKVDGNFIRIENPWSSGSTGVFVSLTLSVASFLRENRDAGEFPSVDDYLEWAQKQSKQSGEDGHYELLKVLGGEDEQAMLARDCIRNVLVLAGDQRSRLGGIVEQTKLLPNMDAKLDYMIHEISKGDSPSLHKDQIAISARVLDILSTGLVGSGVKVVMKKQLDAHKGAAMVVWVLGTQSPHMMLLDIVGGIERNRISLILNENASVGLRAFDGGGNKTELQSKSFPAREQLVILGMWEDDNISLWVNGELQGSKRIGKGFEYLGPACLFGVDIEGKLSADLVHCTSSGQQVEYHFQKDGIWHGSRLDTVTLWERVLQESEIGILAEDPWIMLR